MGILTLSFILSIALLPWLCRLFHNHSCVCEKHIRVETVAQQGNVSTLTDHIKQASYAPCLRACVNTNMDSVWEEDETMICD